MKGRPLWTVAIRRPSDDEFNDVTAAGGVVYVDGTTRAPLPGQEYGGAFVRAYDRSGHELWTRDIGHAGFGIIFSGGGTWADASGVYVGAFAPMRPNGLDVTGPFVRKYDPSGSLLWTEQVPHPEVIGEAVIEAAAAGGATYVSWEEGLHASPTQTDWTGFVERLSAERT